MMCILNLYAHSFEGKNGIPAEIFGCIDGIIKITAFIENLRSPVGCRVGWKSGARLTLTARPLVSHDQAKGGLSYCSAQDPRILFGLGTRAKVDTLEILWPSGERQILRDIPADQYITVEEGKGLTSYRFPSPAKRR